MKRFDFSTSALKWRVGTSKLAYRILAAVNCLRGKPTVCGVAIVPWWDVESVNILARQSRGFIAIKHAGDVHFYIPGWAKNGKNVEPPMSNEEMKAFLTEGNPDGE